MNLGKATELLGSNGINYSSRISTSQFSYFKSGGVAEIVAYPSTIRELSDCLIGLKSLGVPYKVIGETSNLLFLDDARYSCLVSTIHLNKTDCDVANKRISCEAGAMLPDLSRLALLHSIKGFAGLEGIPGTIGGAVFMNAGAYGYSIDQVLDSIELMDDDGVIRVIPSSELGLGYRDSKIKKGEISGVIVRAHFRAELGDRDAIYREMEVFHAKRHKYQDFLYPSLGSVFSGSIYRALGQRDPVYRLVSALYFLVNYKIRIFRRESPINRKWINDFTVKRFGLKFDMQPFSDKTMNTIVNNGQHTDVYLDYIEKINRLIGHSIPVENEIVRPF